MSVLKSLADRHNIGILLVHHLRKQEADDPFLQISGSNGLMGAADTIWLLQRQRTSNMAKLLITGRDMNSRSLRLQWDNHLWNCIEETGSQEREKQDIPDYLWKAADFIQKVKVWQGTATEFLNMAGITDVRPNQFTRKRVEHYYTVFPPKKIYYESHRTSNSRQFLFFYDDDDKSNVKSGIAFSSGDIPKSLS